MKAERNSGPAPSVLVVEDDQETSEFLCGMIARRYPGSVIHRADNGRRGVELFEAHRPDIVVTDIDMPAMNGIEMAGILKELDPDAHIIAATAKSDTHYLLDAIKLGISRYVLKPVDTVRLFEAMDGCIALSSLNRQVKEQNDFIRKLSHVVEQSTNMILIANARGIIEYINPAFSATTGYTTQEVMGQNVRILMPGPAPLDSFEMLWSTVTRGFKWSGEFVHRKKCGQLFTVEASLSPLASEGGSMTHFVAVLQDITERKHAEENIRHLNDQLEQRVQERTAELERSNKELLSSNRELESFCYSVSHDLRAPLRGMSGFSEILQDEYADRMDDTGKECLRRIRAASISMGQLIDDLLDLSRVTRSQLNSERVNLSGLAGKIVRTLGRLEPQRRVEFAIAEGVEAQGDPALIQLALENLLGNAWKYTGREQSPRIEFGSSTVNGEQVYFVRDNGVGFDMAYVAKIFSPFQRLHKVGEFEGNGVGLASVERVVTRHGGRVWAEGEVGKGATFYFTLR